MVQSSLAQSSKLFTLTEPLYFTEYFVSLDNYDYVSKLCMPGFIGAVILWLAIQSAPFHFTRQASIDNKENSTF